VDWLAFLVALSLGVIIGIFRIWKGLDRVLSMQVSCFFKKLTKVEHLNRTSSDHALLLLSIAVNGENAQTESFRTE
jgi:hypothetical protein